MFVFERIFFKELMHNHVVSNCIFSSKSRAKTYRSTGRGKKEYCRESVLISRHGVNFLAARTLESLKYHTIFVSEFDPLPATAAIRGRIQHRPGKRTGLCGKWQAAQFE